KSAEEAQRGRPRYPRIVSAGLAGRSLLSLFLQQPVLDEPRGAPVPGVIRAHAQVGPLDREELVRPRVAQLECDAVLHPADPVDDPEQGLVRAELAGDRGVAAIACVQTMRLRLRGVGAADIDEAIPAGLGDEPARGLRRQPQLLPVIVAFRDDSGAARSEE